MKFSMINLDEKQLNAWDWMKVAVWAYEVGERLYVLGAKGLSTVDYYGGARIKLPRCPVCQVTVGTPDKCDICLTRKCANVFFIGNSIEAGACENARMGIRINSTGTVLTTTPARSGNLQQDLLCELRLQSSRFNTFAEYASRRMLREMLKDKL